MKHRAQGRDGVLQVPLALVLAVIGVASLATWGLLHRWRALTALQLRLDACVGRTALDLSETLRGIEQGNARMRKLRTSLALMPEPRVRALLKAALEVQWLVQEATLARWNTRRAAWLLQRGCDRQADVPEPLPDLGYRTEPPDELGPQPLSWPEGTARSRRVALHHPPRHAFARVSTSDDGRTAFETLETNPGPWRARWTSAD